MRTRLPYLPFLIAASVACQGTDPSVSTDAVAESAAQESTDLFTSNVATSANDEGSYALATNVIAQEGDAVVASKEPSAEESAPEESSGCVAS